MPDFIDLLAVLGPGRCQIDFRAKITSPGSLCDGAPVRASLSGGLQERSQGEPEPLELGSVSSKGKKPPGLGLVRLVLATAHYIRQTLDHCRLGLNG